MKRSSLKEKCDCVGDFQPRSEGKKKDIVASYMYPTEEALKQKQTRSIIQEIQAGLLIQELNVFQRTLNVAMERLIPMLGISKATFHRRKEAGRLGADESDKLIRYARLTGKAIEVLEGIENARAWLLSPQHGLGGEIPFEYAETEIGAREVEDLLNRIEYGVYT